MESGAKASYIGTFEHSFDEKGRITVPAEWRGKTYECNLHVFPSRDNCLKVYPESWLAGLQSGLAGVPLNDLRRKQIEALASMAQFVSWDGAGRIMIKEKLRGGAGLKKEALLVGSADHFEIWTPAARAKQPQIKTTLEDAAEAFGM
jgi:MraZ protein